MPTAAAPSPAVYFARSPLTHTGFQALRASHPAHPAKHRFADDVSSRNYERELKDLPLPDGTASIVLVSGEDFLARTAMVRALIELRHGERAPQQFIPSSENMFRAFIQVAKENESPYLWFLADHFHSHALAIFAAQNPRMRIYCSAAKPEVSASIQRLARIIRLAA